MTIVSGADLQQWLGVTRRPLYQWNQDGLLRWREYGVYESDDVDAFLMAHAYNFPYMPSVAHFRSNELELVDLQVVQEQLSVSRMYARFLAQRHLAHIQFPGVSGHFRVNRQDLMALSCQMRNSVSVEWLAAAVGLTRQTIVRAVAAGELVRVPGPESDRKKTHVSGATATRYLRWRLPTWVSVEDWASECSRPDFALVDASTAAVMLGISEHNAPAELNARRARYTATTLGLYMQVSLAWITEQLQIEPSYRAADVARLFDVTEETVKNWRRKGLITCSIKGHPHPREARYLMRPCWIAYFRANCSPGYKGVAWHFVEWRVAHASPPPLLTLEEVSRRLGRTEQTVLRWTRKGRLQGVLLPTSGWVFDSNGIAKVMRALRRF